MELSFLDELSLWDTLEDPQLAACFGDGSKEILYSSLVVPGTYNNNAGDDQLLLDGFEPLGDEELCNWMESKFPFEDNMTLLEDVDRLLTEDGCLQDLPKPAHTSEELGAELAAMLPMIVDTSVTADVSYVSDAASSEDSSEFPLDVSSTESLKSDGESDQEVKGRGSVQRAKKRPTPYSRAPVGKGRVAETNVENRKSRKRSQNRDAATRYRIKKREEAELIAAEEAELEAKNKDLNMQVENLSREVSYLKNLMKELILAKRK